MEKWPKANMNFYEITNPASTITYQNSGILESDFLLYANNFYEAGEILIEHILVSQDISKLDLWYFSITYLYRQSLELLLKSIIFKLVQNEQDRIDIIKDIRHDVSAAFNKILELTNIDISNNKNALWLQLFLTDISNIDRSSDMFRYPFGNDLSILFDKQTDISLVNTYFNMDKAFSILKDFYNTNTFNDNTYEHAVSPKLFTSGGTYYERSVQGYQFNKREFYPLFTSYEDCGNYLSNIILTENKTHLLMPMCYLYRNAIELGLKRIIIEDSHIDSEKAQKILKRKKHSIQGLWNSISSEVTAHGNPTDPTITNVENYIANFHNLDQTSDLFRYPCNKELQTYFANPTQLDINNVANCFGDLITFLDSVSSMMAYEKEIEAEMAAEYSGYTI